MGAVTSEREVEAGEDRAADTDEDAPDERSEREPVSSFAALKESPQVRNPEEEEEHAQRAEEVAELVAAVVPSVIGDDFGPRVLHARRVAGGEGDDEQGGEDDAAQWREAPQRR